MAFFAARQPILDINRNVYGYELLFRTSTENVFPNVDQEKATSKMIEGLQFDLGLDKIADGRFAFINFTEKSILKAYPSLLPKSQIVIEVLETVKPTKEVLVELTLLAKRGYIIALDDFIHTAEWEPFYKICKIIKIDCLDISDLQLKQIAEVKKRFPHISLLAEKVETYEQFEQYKSLGFAYFQGYFFSKPEIMRSVSMSPSQTLLSCLLNEVITAEPNTNEITKLIETDVALSFKLLRYTQSPLFARKRKIENIKQAIILLGQAELERFIMLLFAASFGENKPSELIRLSMHRAKFCEQLATLNNRNDQISSAFLVGMLSLIDAMLDADIEELIDTMPLSDNIKEALVTNKGWLADVVIVCKIMEKGNWQKMEKASALLALECDQLLSIYETSGEWANTRMQLLL